MSQQKDQLHVHCGMSCHSLFWIREFHFSLNRCARKASHQTGVCRENGEVWTATLKDWARQFVKERCEFETL